MKKGKLHIAHHHAACPTTSHPHPTLLAAFGRSLVLPPIRQARRVRFSAECSGESAPSTSAVWKQTGFVIATREHHELGSSRHESGAESPPTHESPSSTLHPRLSSVSSSRGDSFISYDLAHRERASEHTHAATRVPEKRSSDPAELSFDLTFS